MKLEKITVELLLKEESYITIDDIKMPDDDRFIVKASYYGGHPNYNDILVRIGVLSNMDEYKNFNSITRDVVLLKIKGWGYRVPVEVGETYFRYVKKYLKEHGKEIYPFIRNNTTVFATLTSEVVLWLNKIHGTTISEDICFFHVENNKMLSELYHGAKESYKYLPNGKPSNIEIIRIANRHIGCIKKIK